MNPDITVAAILRHLESICPMALAESWDNVGLLWGDPEAAVRRVMTCLTVTPTTAAEAVEAGAELFLSHHPILFRGTKRVRADEPDGGPLWALARAGVAVASLHTAWDNAVGGINDRLARLFGLEDVRPLRPGPLRSPFKVVVFTPKSDHDRVLASAFAAGAGRIGLYEECSFATPGVGTFFGGEGTDPAVGERGRRERVRERRVEWICPADRLTAVLGAIRAAHSYEEPAIDVYPLHPVPPGPGIGRIGRLPAAAPLDALASRAADILKTAGVQVVGAGDRPIGRLAIACGAGDDFVGDASALGADALLTGEARFHRALEAEARGLALVLAGHHATERPGVEALAEAVGAAFPGLDVRPSRRESDPIRKPMG